MFYFHSKCCLKATKILYIYIAVVFNKFNLLKKYNNLHVKVFYFLEYFACCLIIFFLDVSFLL